MATSRLPSPLARYVRQASEAADCRIVTLPGRCSTDTDEATGEAEVPNDDRPMTLCLALALLLATASAALADYPDRAITITVGFSQRHQRRRRPHPVRSG